MYPEIDIRLKDLVNKASSVLRSYGATEVYLFGSSRTGNFDWEHSDIDLAVKGVAPHDFFSAVGETMCAIGREVDVVDLDAGTAFGKYLTDHKELSRVA